MDEAAAALQEKLEHWMNKAAHYQEIYRSEKAEHLEAIEKLTEAVEHAEIRERDLKAMEQAAERRERDFKEMEQARYVGMH